MAKTPTSKAIQTDAPLQYWNAQTTTLGTNVLIPTGITPDGGVVAVLQDISVVIEGVMAEGTGDISIELALQRTNDGLTAMPAFFNPSVVAVYKYNALLVGAAVPGVVLPEMPMKLDFVGKQIIVEPNISLKISCAGLANAQVNVRIYYTTETMSKADILDILYG